MCGIVGVTGVPNAIELTLIGLQALQHRGQESAGISYASDDSIVTQCVQGTVPNLLALDSLKYRPESTAAIGHVRYATSAKKALISSAVQPIGGKHKLGRFSIVHNGHLSEIPSSIEGLSTDNVSDTDLFAILLSDTEGDTWQEVLVNASKKVTGAYCFLLLADNKVFGIRDPHGFRPLSWARLGPKEGGAGIAIASETCALEAMGIHKEHIHSVLRADYFIASDSTMSFGSSLSQKETSKPGQCSFELAYFARPDSTVFESDVANVRVDLGRRLAQECFDFGYPAAKILAHSMENSTYATVVVPIPDSGMFAAQGFAEDSCIPLSFAVMRSKYIGTRSFIQSTQKDRDSTVRQKFTIIPSLVKNKHVILIDDSLVRGTTASYLVRKIKEAGAQSVHLRLAAPPILHPCEFGMDMPSRAEYIAVDRTEAQIAEELGCESVQYISLEAYKRACHAGRCFACFTGESPLVQLEKRS